MLPAWARDSVTVVRPAMVIERGTKVPDWSGATRTELTGCYVCPQTASADLDGRVNTTQPWSLYAPTGSDVRFGDRIEWQGRVFDVGVPVEVRRDPGGTSMDHIKANLVERRG